MADLVERLALRELVETYALAVDRADAAAVAGLFVPDGELVLFMATDHDRQTARRRGRAEIERAVATIGQYDGTHHTISSTAAVIADGRASGETRCEAHHAKGDEDLVMFLHYLDSYRREDGRWWFSRREVHARWTATLPVRR